jgi:hypothetical protein
MRRRLALGLYALLVSATPALAGIGKGNGEIGFDFGATRFDPNVSGLSAGRLTLRGGYHFSRLFELEAESSASAHYNWNLQNTTRADVVLTTLFANGVFNFHSKGGNVVPYVLVGLGTATLDFPFANTHDSGMARQGGGGCRFFFGGRHGAAFRLQVSRLTEKTFDVTSNHWNWVAGFTWRLGEGS